MLARSNVLSGSVVWNDLMVEGNTTSAFLGDVTNDVPVLIIAKSRVDKGSV
jgi:hypothetical protein